MPRTFPSPGIAAESSGVPVGESEVVNFTGGSVAIDPVSGSITFDPLGTPLGPGIAVAAYAAGTIPYANPGITVSAKPGKTDLNLESDSTVANSNVLLTAGGTASGVVYAVFPASGGQAIRMRQSSASRLEVAAYGTTTNLDLNLVSQGAGIVRANGSPIAINPMTTAGDLIVGGVAGAPTRLAIGANSTVLTVSGGSITWGPAGSVAVPITAATDIGVQPNSVSSNALNVHNAASGVNGLQAGGTATGNSPILSAVGADSNLSVVVTPKGTGGLTLSSGALTVPSVISSPVSVIALRPAGVANTALQATNAASAVSGVQILGSATNAGAVTNAGPQLNVISSDANSSLIVNLVGAAFFQVVQAPQTGGIIVANATQNTGGAQYGSGMFNGAMQIFRPSGAFGPSPLFDAAMPWLLMGDNAGAEEMSIGTQFQTVNYIAPGNPPTGSGKYTSFMDSVARDMWLRQIGWKGGVQSYIRLGFFGGDVVSPTYPQGMQFSTVAITNDIQDPMANGFTLHGVGSGGNPIIEGRGTDTNVGITLKTQGNANLSIIANVGIFQQGTTPNYTAYTTVGGQGLVVAMATSPGAYFTNTLANDAIFSTYNSTAARVLLGPASTLAPSSVSTLTLVAGVGTTNYFQMTAKTTGGVPTLEVLGDTNTSMNINARGTGDIFMRAVGLSVSNNTGTGNGASIAATIGSKQAVMVLASSGSVTLFTDAIANDALFLTTSNSNVVRIGVYDGIGPGASSLIVGVAANPVVNSVEIDGAVTLAAPAIYAVGTDTDVGLSIGGKGVGVVNIGTHGRVQALQVASTGAGTVNYVAINGNSTGNAPQVAAKGTDTNVNLFLNGQGTGNVYALCTTLAVANLSAPTVVAATTTALSTAIAMAVATAGAQTFADSLTNDGLVYVANTSARILFGTSNSVYSSLIVAAAAASQVNQVTVTGSATGVSVNLSATGNDTNISIKVSAKGTGNVYAYGAGFAQVATANPNVAALNNAGTQETAIALATASAFAFSDTASSDSLIYASGGSGTIRIGTYGTLASTLIVAAVVATQVNSVQVTGSASGSGVIVAAVGTDSNIALKLNPKGTANLTTTAQQFVLSNNTEPQVIVQNTGATQGFGAALVTTGAQVFTDSLANDLAVYMVGTSALLRFGTSNSVAATFTIQPAAASQVNQVSVAGSATGVQCTIAALGTDTNLGIVLKGKGTGTVTLGTSGSVVVQNSSAGKVSFYGATPVVRPAAIAAPAGGATVDSQARTAITSILNAIGAAAGGIGITA